MIIPRQYQLDIAEQASKIIAKYGIVYLAMEERTGKSLISLLIAKEYKNVLVVTKKKALDDWIKLINEFNPLISITNYHNAKNIKGQHFDLVILDEAHNYISAYPKPGKIWKELKPLCYGMNTDIVYISATPYAQGMQLLYHQFALSFSSPWKDFETFYKWYATFAKRDEAGNTEKIWIQGREIETYKSVDNNKILDFVEHLFITKTRKEIGFTEEPKDNLHYVKLSENITDAYNKLLKQRVLEFKNNNKSYTILADTILKLKTSLHMLEGGVAKIDNEYLTLLNTEKIDYIKNIWGDNQDVVIMYNYIAEGIKLKNHFKEALLLQATSYAEGIDLSDKKHLIIYSQDFSTARYTQRRARQTGMNRVEPINVHFLLVKKAISEQVYNTVSINKKNFIDSLFQQTIIGD